MREEHPIDNQFREALFGAEVQPPASVWAGVKSRRRKRGLAFWSRRRGLTIVTLFVALGAGAYWALHVDREPLQQPSEQRGVEVAQSSVTEPSSVSTATTAEQSTPVATTSSTPSMIKEVSEPVHPTAGAEPPSSRATTVAMSDDVIRASEELLPASEKHPAEDMAGTIIVDDELPSTVPVSPVLDPGAVQRMDGVRTRWHATDHLLAPEAAAISTYVLPNSEWWLGVQVGWYDVQRQWSGGSERLRDALNASEAWTSTIGIGAVVGRTWRSGWGFSLGAEHERSEQQFRHVDRTVRTDESIETMMVTLNTQIIFLDMDTIVTQVVDEHVAEGIDQRSVLRIPVEGHWRGSWHRWMYGLGAGIAGEFTRTTSRSILVEDADGRIISVSPEGDELRERYPAVLLGTLSADVGYLLHERWALWVSPAYMRSITAFNTGSDVFAEPERFGLRLRLSHTFNCSR